MRIPCHQNIAVTPPDLNILVIFFHARNLKTHMKLACEYHKHEIRLKIGQKMHFRSQTFETKNFFHSIVFARFESPSLVTFGDMQNKKQYLLPI